MTSKLTLCIASCVVIVAGCANPGDRPATSSDASASSSAASGTQGASGTSAATGAGTATAASTPPSAAQSAAPSPAPAPKAASAPVQAITSTAFVEKAAHAGAFEIEASKLAQTKAKSEQVKAFAKRMVTDHTKVASNLRAAAGNTKIPAGLDAADKAKLDSLKRKSGAEFDAEYKAVVGVAAHQDAVSLFEAYSQQAPEGKLKKFAASSLPELKDHLAMANRLSLGASDSDASTTMASHGTGTTAHAKP